VGKAASDSIEYISILGTEPYKSTTKLDKLLSEKRNTMNTLTIPKLKILNISNKEQNPSNINYTDIYDNQAPNIFVTRSTASSESSSH
jgi:hypothetical protein